ncbi:MAG: ABC transporter permease [Acidimicrobiia bacterium]
MTSILDSLRVLRHATAFAIDELGAVYSWHSWTFGWVLRVIAQIIFYTLIGVLVEDPALVQFLLIGNVTLIAAGTAMFAIPSTQWERYAGTLPLLVAAPSRMMWVFLGRSVEWFIDGLATSTIGLVVVAPIFGVPISIREVLWVMPLLLLVIVTTYGLATFLGAVVLRKPDLRNVVLNVTTGVAAIVTGANVPVEFFPTPIQWFAQIFPVTHGLQAIRETIGGARWAEIAPNVAACAAVGIIWIAIAALSFERFAESGRRDGSIEFGE